MQAGSPTKKPSTNDADEAASPKKKVKKDGEASKTPAKKTSNGNEGSAEKKTNKQKKGGKEGSALEWQNQNRIMKFLKYTKEKKAKATDEEKEDAARAIAVYEGLADNDQRNHFLKEFDAKDGKLGNLKWVTTFSKSIIGLSGAEVTCNENFVTRTVH